MRDDVRSALRQIRRNPGVACAVVFTLALGAGAVTAVLTIADPILFRPLPFPDADRLFVMSASPDFLHAPDEVRAEAAGGAFESVGDFRLLDAAPIGTATEASLSYGISPGLLRALGVQPALGRAFRADEYDSRAPVALITYGLWQDAFGGRPDVLQQRVTFAGSGGRSYQIIGVLPREFFLPQRDNDQPAVLVPYKVDASRPDRLAFPIVRLRVGVTVAAAAAQMQAIVRGVEQDYAAFGRHRRVRFTPLRQRMFGDVRTPVAMLLAATIGILLLASANLAQLTTARLRARRREFGVRRAIGASRARLVRQLLIEVCGLAIVGGLAALGAGVALSRLAMSYLPPLAHAYRVVPPALDLRIAVMTASMVLVTLGIFGVIPAIRTSSGEVRGWVDVVPRDSAVRRVIGGDPILIFVQATAAVALLVTGLLVVRSFLTLVGTPVGFDARDVRSIDVTFPNDVSQDPARLRVASRRLYEALRDRLGDRVAAAGGLPALTLNTALMRPDVAPRDAAVDAWPVSGAFFHVMRLTLVRGRVFTDEEAFSNAPVAVIDQRATELLWPGIDPLGRTVKEVDGTLRTIIGVVRTVRTDLTGLTFQSGSGFVPLGTSRTAWFLYRVPRAPVDVRDLQSIAARIAAGTSVAVQPIDPFDRQLAQPRFLAIVLGALTAIAVLLTLVGVFGIVTHEVGRRTKELGIRIALGADAPSIQRLVLRGSLLPALAGGLVGLSASLWFTGALRAILVGVDPYDPTIYALTLLSTLAIVGLASLRPALRASHTDPVLALRTE